MTSVSATGSSRLREKVFAYIALTKPRIIELLLITTVPAMAVAWAGWPNTWLVVATLVGGSLSAGGANALNNFYDRDIDEVMVRTRRRPLPQHRVDPGSARIFGWILGVAGFWWLWVFANMLAATISTLALLFYVFVYTRVLKRTTAQNIVIGGAAGSAPVLVGWAAVTGTLHPAAWVMFAIVFCWTPAHFWALAVRFRDDYQAAGVPMLPTVRGVREASLQMLAYAGLTALFSLLLVPAGRMGWIYLVTAVALGGWFVVETALVVFRPHRAMKAFGFSNLYLAALFGAMLVDRIGA